jgi:hypothetical protein
MERPGCIPQATWDVVPPEAHAVLAVVIAALEIQFAALNAQPGDADPSCDRLGTVSRNRSTNSRASVGADRSSSAAAGKETTGTARGVAAMLHAGDVRIFVDGDEAPCWRSAEVLAAACYSTENSRDALGRSIRLVQ